MNHSLQYLKNTKRKKKNKVMQSKKRFGIVSYDIITSPEITPQAKALYSTLACYANKERICYPSIARLADELNISVRTVDRLIKELKIKGCIKRIGRKIQIE